MDEEGIAFLAVPVDVAVDVTVDVTVALVETLRKFGWMCNCFG